MVYGRRPRQCNDFLLYCAFHGIVRCSSAIGIGSVLPGCNKKAAAAPRPLRFPQHTSCPLRQTQPCRFCVTPSRHRLSFLRQGLKAQDQYSHYIVPCSTRVVKDCTQPFQEKDGIAFGGLTKLRKCFNRNFPLRDKAPALAGLGKKATNRSKTEDFAHLSLHRGGFGNDISP